MASSLTCVTGKTRAHAVALPEVESGIEHESRSSRGVQTWRPCRGCPVRTRHLCQALVAPSRSHGQTPSPRIRSFPAETTLQQEFATATIHGVLQKGYIRSECTLADGRRSILGLNVPGDLIGAALEVPHAATLVAATDVEICTFDLSALRRVMDEEPVVGLEVLREAMAQHARQLEMIWWRGALDSRQRIISLLVMATEIMPVEHLPDGSLILTVEISRKDWADFTNTVVETISRTLAGLDDKGLVTHVSDRRFRIRDLSLLAGLAGMTTTDRAAFRVK